MIRRLDQAAGFSIIMIQDEPEFLLPWGPYHFMKVFIKFPLPSSALVPAKLSLLPSHLAQLDLEPPTQQIV